LCLITIEHIVNDLLGILFIPDFMRTHRNKTAFYSHESNRFAERQNYVLSVFFVIETYDVFHVFYIILLWLSSLFSHKT
jgi:hypothetical protein